MFHWDCNCIGFSQQVLCPGFSQWFAPFRWRGDFNCQRRLISFTNTLSPLPQLNLSAAPFPMSLPPSVPSLSPVCLSIPLYSSATILPPGKVFHTSKCSIAVHSRTICKHGIIGCWWRFPSSPQCLSDRKRASIKEEKSDRLVAWSRGRAMKARNSEWWHAYQCCPCKVNKDS